MSEFKKVSSTSPGGAVMYEIMPRAHTAVDGARDIRTERVDALRAQIAGGTYQPDAREIAEAILRRGL